MLHRYKKGELNGKNVSMIMPAPFSQRHNSYLRNYVNTGKGKILDTNREVSGVCMSHAAHSVLQSWWGALDLSFARDLCDCLDAKAQVALHRCPVATLHVGLEPGTRHELLTELSCFTCPQVVALHKDRYVFPVTLKVTQIMGTGVDATFMGVMKVSGKLLYVAGS